MCHTVAVCVNTLVEQSFSNKLGWTAAQMVLMDKRDGLHYSGFQGCKLGSGVQIWLFGS